MDELDKQLQAYYRHLRQKDQESTPDFEDFVPDLPIVRKTRSAKPGLGLKIAAALLLLASLTWQLWPEPTHKPTIPDPVLLTNGLAAPPVYLWDWESPTQSLLPPPENNAKTNKE
ncbi:MAG: hypothetical protein AAFU64_00390 [Bacteroidota bacterium]